MDTVNHSTSGNRQEGINRKREDNAGKVDGASIVNDMKSSNDLLYMYPAKEGDNTVRTKIEDGSPSYAMFPEKLNSNMQMDKAWKNHTLGRNTQAAIAQIENKKRH
eukprot:TRINITY_DN38443_c0_g1_i1.p1 TRINITY_DN38443_c0_g1~~TRINITY_DN38443_c0_g1_i1.p1  ORF type:complete len:106 (+),score=22.28 TRINITY_DN38443_c0_g1_i1:74-391(+)